MITFPESRPTVRAMKSIFRRSRMLLRVKLGRIEVYPVRSYHSLPHVSELRGIKGPDATGIDEI
jgi:hypothetical protein